MIVYYQQMHLSAFVGNKQSIDLKMHGSVIKTNFISFMPYSHPEQRTHILRTVHFTTNLFLWLNRAP
jgi:hypothetical protein